jgi:hypothetical protein
MRDLTMRPAKPEPQKCGRKPMPPHFTAMELRVLDAVVDPNLENIKQIAHAIGIASEGACKQTLGHIYKKLGMAGGTLRLLTIWAMTHEHALPQISGGQY